MLNNPNNFTLTLMKQNHTKLKKFVLKWKKENFKKIYNNNDAIILECELKNKFARIDTTYC